MLDAAHPEAARLLVDYLKSAHPKHHIRQPYKRAMAEFLTWLDGQQIALRKITPHDLRRYLNGLTNGLPPSTINRHLAAIRGFYSYLQEHAPGF